MHVATTKQSRNFVKAYHDVLESTEINSNEKLVYLFLLSYQETASVESIFPSNEYIAQRLGLSVRTVIRATATLAEAGLIAKTRRFNKSNTFEVTNCHVWMCQTVTSGRDKLADYKNRVLDQKEDQLDEEKGQNQDASLSQVNIGLNDKGIHCDKSDSDLNLDEEISEEKSIKREELVTQTYASMPAEDNEPLDDDFDDEPLDYNDDCSYDTFTATQDDFDDEPLDDDDVKVTNQNIFSTGNRIRMAPHQLKRHKQLNRNNPVY